MGDINLKQKRRDFTRYFIVLIVLIGIISLFLPVVNAAETLTFNPIADTFVESDSPSVNQGDFMWLMVDFSNQNTSEILIRNSYLLFDLTPLSTNVSIVNSATLELHRSWAFPQTVDVGVHSCSDTQWNETEITWSTAPSFSPEPIDVQTLNPDDEDTWISWDVTEAVKNSEGNYLSLVLTVEGENGIYITGFFSKESKFEIPRLVLDYEVIPEFPSWAILPIFLTATLIGILVRKRLMRTRITAS